MVKRGRELLILYYTILSAGMLNRLNEVTDDKRVVILIPLLTLVGAIVVIRKYLRSNRTGG